jgi:LysM repeat protein
MLIVAALAATSVAGPASAGIERAGTTAANFLAIGSNPAVLAMGGAGLSLAGGLSAFDWNPATLASFGPTEAMFTHAAIADQTAQEWAGCGSRLHFAGLSGAVTGLFQNEGSFDGRDALGNPTGSFDVSSMAVSAGLARAIAPFMTAGLGLKYASENLGGVRGSGVALDLGLQVRSAGFGFGAAAQNAFGRMRYGSASYAFPANYGIGFSYQQPSPTGLRVAFDMNFPAAYYSDFRAGVEWRWNERFALRTGYRAELGAASGEPLSGPTFGMGAGARGMWFDYGYLVSGTGSGQHRIALTFHPGGMMSSDGPEHRDGFKEASTETDESARVAAEKPKSGATQATAGAREKAPATPPSRSQQTAASAAPVTAPPSTAARSQPNAASPVNPPAASSAAPAGSRETPGASSASSSARPSKAAFAPAPSSSSAAATAPARSSAPAPSPLSAAATAPARSSAPAAATVPATPPQGAPAAAPTPAPATAAPARPDTARAQAPAPPAPNPGPRPKQVRVKSGETMAQIARTWGTSVAAIMMENNMVSDQVRPGQVLKLPRR